MLTENLNPALPPDKRKFKEGLTIVRHNEKRRRIQVYHKYKNNNVSADKENNSNAEDIEEMQSEEYIRKMIEWMYLDRIKFKESDDSDSYGCARLVKKLKLDPSDYGRDPSYYPYNECSKTLKRALYAWDITAGGAAIPKNIPVYCDMPMKTTDIIFTEAFEYIDQKEYILTPQQKLDFKKPMISCNCSGKCVPETCACMKLNMECYGRYLKLVGNARLMEVFDDSPRQRLEPQERFLVMCGDHCRCGPDCGHHVRQFEKKENDFEIFRDHKRRGFCARVLNPLNLGEIVCEVIGAVTPLNEIQGIKSKEKYSWRLFNRRSRGDLARLYKAAGCRSIPASCRPEKVDKWFIETCYQGNIARFINNGCFRNVAPIRVIANYLHPVYHRIFLMAMAPIPVGAALTMNYRQTIQYPIVKCRCGSHICYNKPYSRSYVNSMFPDEYRAAVLRMYKVVQESVDRYEEFYAHPEPKGELPPVDLTKCNAQIHVELRPLRRINALNLKLGEIHMQIRMLRAVQNELDVSPMQSGFNSRQLKKEYSMYEEEIQNLKKHIKALPVYRKKA